MPFNRDEVANLLAACHRRCCLCHRFCGVKIETDHIRQTADGGNDSIANAIPVCFDCHAEIHSYNDKHPRGRKFTSEELAQHKAQWLEVCANRPESMLLAARDGDVGPLQALVDELEYNRTVVDQFSGETSRGALFHESQFLRAIREGMIAILAESLKASILAAYASISRANQHILAEVNQDVKMRYQGTASMNARNAIANAAPMIEAARQELIRFLGTE
jgi:HNH endonuclease